MNLAERKREERRNSRMMRLGASLIALSLFVTLILPPPKARAVVGIDDATIAAIVAAVLASYGMTMSSSGMDKNGVKEQIGALIDQYLTSEKGGMSRDEWVEQAWQLERGTVLDGAVNWVDGKLGISSTVANAITDMASWVYNKYNTISNAGAAEATNEAHRYDIYKCKGQFIADTYGRQYQCWQVAEHSGSETKEFTLGTIVYNKGDAAKTISFPNGNYVKLWTENNYIHFNSKIDNTSHGLEKEISAGFVVEPKYKQLALYLYNPTYAKVTKWCRVCYLSELTVANKDEAFYFSRSESMSVPQEVPKNREIVIVPHVEMQTSLDDELDEILNAVAEGTLTVDREKDREKEGVVAGEGAATGEEATTGEQAKAEEATEELPDVNTLGLPALGDALSTRFPFSIPWDIARGIELVAVPAKTPRFEVDFLKPMKNYTGKWKADTTVVIDFSKVELLGQLTRWASTIGFCLLLASGTKKLLWTA